MGEVTHNAVLDSKVKPDLWAQWRKKYNAALTEFASGDSRVSEKVSYRETHKLIVPVQGGAREQFVSLEFESRIEVNCPQTADDILDAQEITRELLTHSQLEWMNAMRDRMLDYARSKLKQG